MCSLLTKQQQPVGSLAATPLQERCCQPLSSRVIHVRWARSMSVSAQQQASARVPPVLYNLSCLSTNAALQDDQMRALLADDCLAAPALEACEVAVAVL